MPTLEFTNQFGQGNTGDHAEQIDNVLSCDPHPSIYITWGSTGLTQNGVLLAISSPKNDTADRIANEIVQGAL
jgi:hypothetical protein